MSSQLKENRYETSDHPSIANRRLRCLDDSGSERRGLRSRCAPGRLCRRRRCCGRRTSCCSSCCSSCCCRSTGRCSSQGVLIFLQYRLEICRGFASTTQRQDVRSGTLATVSLDEVTVSS